MGKKRILAMIAAAMLLLAACGTDTEKPEAEPADSGNGISDTEASESSGQDTEVSDSIEKENTDQKFANINIDLEKGTLKICSGDTFTFSYADGKEAEYTIADDTLYIHAQKAGDLVLTLPDDSTYDTVVLSVEEGNIYAEQLFQIKMLDLEVEDGEVKLENAVVSDNSGIEAEQGTVLLYGQFTGTINAQCEEAHLNMEITGDQKDFNYNLTVQDAEIRIDDDNYHEPGNEKIDNGADDTMTLSCTQGNIDIDFIN